MISFDKLLFDHRQPYPAPKFLCWHTVFFDTTQFYIFWFNFHFYKFLQVNFSLPCHDSNYHFHTHKKKKTKPTVFVLFLNSMSCCKKPEKRGQVHQMGGRARYWLRWDFLARFSHHIHSNTSCRRKKQEKKIGMRSFRDRIRFLSF